MLQKLCKLLYNIIYEQILIINLIKNCICVTLFTLDYKFLFFCCINKLFTVDLLVGIDNLKNKTHLRVILFIYLFNCIYIPGCPFFSCLIYKYKHNVKFLKSCVFFIIQQLMLRGRDTPENCI